MDERVWYIFQNNQQMGPFDGDQIKQLHTNSMINQDGYLFKVGWKDWRPIQDCLGEFGVDAPSSGGGLSEGELAVRRQQAPRATINGRVDVHNDAQFSAGAGVNISATGIFVETTERVFKVGEHLKLTVRVEGIQKPFNVLAKVIRLSEDPRFPIGYGMVFENIPEDIKGQIQELVESQNLERNKVVSS